MIRPTDWRLACGRTAHQSLCQAEQLPFVLYLPHIWFTSAGSIQVVENARPSNPIAVISGATDQHLASSGNACESLHECAKIL